MYVQGIPGCFSILGFGSVELLLHVLGILLVFIQDKDVKPDLQHIKQL